MAYEKSGSEREQVITVKERRHGTGKWYLMARRVTTPGGGGTENPNLLKP
jgi:hypothetical protein